jgi:hypothetical protein
MTKRDLNVWFKKTGKNVIDDISTDYLFIKRDDS